MSTTPAKKPKRVPLIKTNKARHMVITPVARISFPTVFTPRAFEDDPDGIKYYQCDFIFNSLDELKGPYQGKKTQTISVLQAIHNVKCDQWGKDKDAWPKFPYPVTKKGNERTNEDGEVLEGYADKIFIKAKSGEKYPPKIIGIDGRPLTSDVQVYGGCYARAQLLARPYQFGKNFGVKFTLLQLMKVKDGEKFGMPSDVFDISELVDDESSDFDSETDDVSEDDTAGEDSW